MTSQQAAYGQPPQPQYPPPYGQQPYVGAQAPGAAPDYGYAPGYSPVPPSYGQSVAPAYGQPPYAGGAYSPSSPYGQPANQPPAADNDADDSEWSKLRRLDHPLARICGALVVAWIVADVAVPRFSLLFAVLTGIAGALWVAHLVKHDKL